ncbi:hypothetical protein D3C72_1774800 [compost metagenome]
MVVQAKTCKSEIAPVLGLDLIFAVVEICAAVADVASALRGHLVDQDGLGLVQAEVKEHCLEWQFVCAPHGPVRAPADVAHLVVVQLGKVGGELVANSAVRLVRAFAGETGDVLEIKRLRRGCARQQRGSQSNRRPRCAAGSLRKRGKNSVHADI